METLKNRPITKLKGVGPKMAETLGKLGIHNYLDLLFHLPFRYQDRTRITPIAMVQPSQIAIIEGEIIKKEMSKGRKPTLLIYLKDETGVMAVRFFNFFPNMVKRFEALKVLRCYGEVRYGLNRLEMSHPEVLNFLDQNSELEERMTPIYSLTAGITQRQMQGFIDNLLSELKDEHFPAYLEDEDINLKDALYFLHKPPTDVNIERLEQKHYPVQEILALEEIVAHQIALKRARAHFHKERSQPIHLDPKAQATFRENLPFTFTNAQNRVISEIEQDLQSQAPMMRLVQGDVGSGKTVVAASALIHAAKAGFQAVFMAPTELLAEQHFINLEKWLTPLNIPTILLTGKLTEKQKREAQQKIKSGEVSVIIGTHAVFQESVEYQALNLVIIDEQHRFGVEQRLTLQAKAPKGFTPHQLMMTATPIPRTLAMTLYADLSSSVIDEYPPNRIPITTTVVSDKARDKVIERVKAQCQEGTQVYWVCTLIEESEVLPAKAAEKAYEDLCERLPHLRIGLIHGRQKASEKEAIMASFKAHELDILVATTVIEVGVDVPNASIMIIENAERLGLSQLHQLRGRVGRGSKASFCLLIYSPPLSQMTQERLEIMQATNNGFEIAEKDFELRGAGDIFGTRQTGEFRFRMADLFHHQPLIERATEIANRVIDDPQLTQKLIDRWIGESGQFVWS
ncbi:ATP-dependent DNA helicase RecG [Ignatzschineria larvae DSM 13226]|uniref:ATP-dependent DNA helicase RecG n=1 Tax=Ignatzschineria larvae DSM 13226 TaxID=1111732 RepID=A0ABZ3BZ02_9GAMM|nr:ATP-dependent DNA helicase RecG [Ignatzschineria larvae]